MTILLDLDWTQPLLAFVERIHGSTASQRGRAYANGRRVRHLTLLADGYTVQAAVQGSMARPYLAELTLEGDYIAAQCSCPIGLECKHDYALALMLLGEAWRQGSEFRDRIRPLLPADWRNFSNLPRPDVYEGVRELFAKVADDPRPQPAPVPAPVSKSSIIKTAMEKIKNLHTATNALKNKTSDVKPNEALPWWEKLGAAKSDPERQRSLTEAFYNRLGKPAYYYQFDYKIGELVALHNNAAILMQLEKALESLAHSQGRLLRPGDPAYLELLASPELQTAYAAYQRQRWQGYLHEWIEQTTRRPAPGQASSCTLDLVWHLEPTVWDIPTLAFQLLITTAKMDHRSRKPQAIRQLHSDLQSGTRSTAPLMREVVAWINNSPDVIPHYYYQKSDAPWDAEGTIPVNSVLGWIGVWGRRGLLRWEDGTLVDYDPRPARLVIKRTATGGQEWAVELPPPPGSPMDTACEDRPLGEVTIFFDRMKEMIDDRLGLRSFYVRQGGTILPLDACGMSLRALAAARALGEPPVEMLLGRPQGVSLAQRLAPSGAAASGLLKAVPVRPVIELKYLEGEWITVSAYARSESGHVFLHNAEGEWLLAPPGEAARRWLIESPFDEADAETAEPLPLAAGPENDNDNNAINANGNGAGEAAEGAGEAANVAEAESRLVVPREADLAPVEAWLARLVPIEAESLELGSGRVNLRWLATPGASGELLDLWDERPSGPVYLGNSALLRLLNPLERPSLSVSVESAGVDWLKVSVTLEGELARLTAEEVQSLLAASRQALVRLPDGRFYRRAGLEALQQELETLENAGIMPGGAGQRLHALQLAGESGRRLIELGDGDGRLAELSRQAQRLVKEFKGIPTAPVSEVTAAFLRPYQHAGSDFLTWAGQTFGGALLADDMGLGKTIQVLAALTALRRQAGEHRPSLVICPASVAHNWEREARRFAPELKTLVLERGPGRKAFHERLGEYDLVIKNYALTRRDADVLRRYEWLLICVDEAQAIKNPNASLSAVVRSLPARCRIALTGTPIENRLGDLLSIMAFAVPGFLDGLDSGRRGLHDDALAMRQLRARLRPVLLRRLKSEVAPELPDRIEERIDCEMTENQRLAYLAEVKRARELLQGLQGQKVAGPGRIQILAALTRLRQICCDPELVQLRGLGSGKVEELMELLPPILEAGHKVLLFSQFVRMLNRLHERLDKAKIKTWMLTGQTQHRQELVDSFESDPTPGVFLISLKAGGTGLNLTSASHVVLFDPWWNPAVEAQAIDRTHRIGQDKTVLAFRLVTEGTIEERILELQERKRALVRDVLEDDSFNRTLSREDFEYLLG